MSRGDINEKNIPLKSEYEPISCSVLCLSPSNRLNPPLLPSLPGFQQCHGGAAQKLWSTSL